jgi:hypothetical protein
MLRSSFLLWEFSPDLWIRDNLMPTIRIGCQQKEVTGLQSKYAAHPVAQDLPTVWGMNIRRARFQPASPSGGSDEPNSNSSAMPEIPYDLQRFGLLRFE